MRIHKESPGNGRVLVIASAYPSRPGVQLYALIGLKYLD